MMKNATVQTIAILAVVGCLGHLASSGRLDVVRNVNAADKSSRRNGTYTVWVFKSANGEWQKQGDRTLTTDDAGKARSYVDTVKGFDGWTATSNLPLIKQDDHSSHTPTTVSLEGTAWTYVASLEGCVFRFDSGHRLWSTNYHETGTWNLQGQKVTMEIPYGSGAGPNVFSGEISVFSNEIHCVVTSSPNPNNIGVEFILRRLPLPGFT